MRRLLEAHAGWAVHGLLPRGRTLPGRVAEKRHRILLAFLWLHVPALLALGYVLGEASWRTAMLPLALAPVAFLAGLNDVFSLRVRSALTAVGLLGASAVLVHMTNGLTESHFHFFVVIVAIALYEDWLLLGLGVGVVLLHHGIAGALGHDAVFAHTGNPWLWALIHAAFVAAAAAASVVAWRLNEDVWTENEAALEQARASQAVFYEAFNRAPIGVALVGLDGRWLEVNRSLCEIVGYSEQELLARSFQDITHPDDLDEGLANVAQLVAGEISSYQADKRYIKASGEEVWVQLNTSLVRDAAGAPSFTVAQIQDIDERKRSEDAMAHLAGIVDAAGDAIYSIDGNGVALTWNSGAERMYGFSRSEIIGKRVLNIIVPPEARDEAVRAFIAATADRSPANFETTRVGKDGRRIDVSIGLAPLDQTRGNDAFAVIARDVSAERERERKQHELERKLQEAQRLESLGVMAGGIAHDFNNLLMGVLGEVSLARDEPDDSVLAARLERIETAARRAGDLTRQLLAYAGSKTTILAPVDLSHAVEEMSQLLTTAIPSGVRVELALADDLPNVTADHAQLQQVVMNLITNAAEAYLGSPGVIRVRTSSVVDSGTKDSGVWFVRPRSDTTCVCLEVEDDGSGMDEETLKRIFDPFFTTKFTGRGLGLAAILGVIRAHDGGIQVDSEVGRGTTFRVLLPASGVVAIRAVSRSSDAGHGGIDATVLVVDDEPIVLEVSVAMLEHLGATTVSASSGQEALRLAGEVPIDAALIDVTMPGMNGVELLRELRRRYPDLPVLLSSGYSEHAAGELTDHLTGFVPKPYSARELAAAFAALLASPVPDLRLSDEAEALQARAALG